MPTGDDTSGAGAAVKLVLPLDQNSMGMNFVMNRKAVMVGALSIALGFVLNSGDQCHAQLGGLFGDARIETIDTQDLNKLLSKQRELEATAEASGEEAGEADFVLVDVRTDDETSVSIIRGAITKAQFEKERDRYRGRTVIPYCTVGGRSGAYAKKLAKDGVKVKNYKGSILQWAAAGLPFVTLDGEPTNRVHTYSDRYQIPAKYEQVTK